jgi:DNA polymerase lambda
MGSFRRYLELCHILLGMSAYEHELVRGKKDCGDIDILITRPVDDGKNHHGVVKTLIRKLHEIELLTEDLSLPEDWDDLECTYRGLCKLPHEGKRRRRIDILAVPWQSRGAALLYYTVSMFKCNS